MKFSLFIHVERIHAVQRRQSLVGLMAYRLKKGMRERAKKERIEVGRNSRRARNRDVETYRSWYTRRNYFFYSNA